MILTVVIAAKDAPEHLLRCCLASFARLDHARDIEILIVNSGLFPADSRALAGAFGGFRTIDTPPRGVYAAFNAGVAEASGRYLLFFGVDDIALPGMDAAIDALLAAKSEFVLFAAATYMQGYGISAPSRVRSAILFRNWCQQSLFYAKAYLTARPFDVNYRIQADHKANIEILADRSLTVGRSQDVVAYFSDGGMSQTSYDVAFRRDLPRIAGETFGAVYRAAVTLKQRLADAVKGRPDGRRKS